MSQRYQVISVISMNQCKALGDCAKCLVSERLRSFCGNRAPPGPDSAVITFARKSWHATTAD